MFANRTMKYARRVRHFGANEVLLATAAVHFVWARPKVTEAGTKDRPLLSQLIQI